MTRIQRIFADIFSFIRENPLYPRDLCSIDNFAFKFLTIYEKLANIVQFNLKENRLCNNQEDIKCGPVT